jgi:hypothetical protein
VGTSLSWGKSFGGAWGKSFGVPVSPIVLMDMHDGGPRKHRFADEIETKRLKREDLIEAYERLVEGKVRAVQAIVKPFADTPAKANKTIAAHKIDFDKMLADIDRTERLWNLYVEMDDEDILLLL